MGSGQRQRTGILSPVLGFIDRTDEIRRAEVADGMQLTENNEQERKRRLQLYEKDEGTKRCRTGSDADFVEKRQTDDGSGCLRSARERKMEIQTGGHAAASHEGKGGGVKEQNINLYTPLLDKEKYTYAQTKSFVEKLYNGSVKDLAVSLFRGAEMTEEDIEEIRKMFDL